MNPESRLFKKGWQYIIKIYILLLIVTFVKVYFIWLIIYGFRGGGVSAFRLVEGFGGSL